MRQGEGRCHPVGRLIVRQEGGKATKGLGKINLNSYET
jgi:hypothetical protein